MLLSITKPMLAKRPQANSWSQRGFKVPSITGSCTDMHLEAISGKHLSTGTRMCMSGQLRNMPLVDNISNVAGFIVLFMTISTV